MAQENEDSGEAKYPVLSVAGVIFCILYLINPFGAFVELIPDVAPVIGNIDEVFISGLLFTCLRNLGFRIPGLDAPRKTTQGKAGESKPGDSQPDNPAQQ